MEPTQDQSTGSAGSSLKRWGPLAAIVVVILVVAVVVVVSGSDDDKSDDSGGGTAAQGTGYEVELESGETITLPEGVIPFDVAEREGLDIDWPDTCDTERGTAAVPTYFAPACYAPFDGDNGGATDEGVTEDTIKVVVYQGPDNDPIIDAIAKAVTNDTNAETLEAYEGFIPYFETYYETYGRKVEFIPFVGSGNALDEVAARADAVKIAEEIQPFAVWGGPFLTDAFADELASQGILDIGLAGGSESPDYYQEKDPYLFQIGAAPSQTRQHASRYICAQLAGEPAEHAGDEELQSEERTFGLIWINTGPGSEKTLEDFEAGLGECDVELAATAEYENPLDVSAVAPGVIAKMKDAGVTSVIVTGDPLTPATWTSTATEQDYFPEWIVAGSALVDTAIYSRTYDQEQWAHAFGITQGSVRLDPQASSATQLYTWFNCEAPAADDTIELLFATPALFYSVVQGVGPNLTRQAFRDALFLADPTPRGISNPSLSWGEGKGRWDEVDYQGVDDATEIWWDPQAEGPDETGTEGAGLWVFSNGGKRYLVGEWDDAQSAAFDEEGGVTIYDEPPPGESYPDYPSPCGGGGNGGAGDDAG